MRTRLLIAAAGLMLVVAGCSAGGGTNGAGGAGGSTSGGGTGQTVQVQAIGSMTDVLTDSGGRALYFSDEESGGQVVCSSSDCTAIWLPLTTAGGEPPTGPEAVSGRLDTLMRPDGMTQVTLDGKPLYTFSLDEGPGTITGDGLQDSFSDGSFTWHVATASGASGGGSTQSPGNGYGY